MTIKKRHSHRKTDRSSPSRTRPVSAGAADDQYLSRRVDPEASGLRSFEPERPYGFRWMCASTLLHSVGIFVIRKFFISAAMRNCPAFLMASVRFDPCGNFLAFARASDALASQS
jgi:hypothetical protein